MAIDWTSVKSALRGWFLPATGLADGAVIWANQNGPRPTSNGAPIVPFATINYRLAVARVGVYDEEQIDADTPGQINRTAQRRLTVSLNTYGPGAIALMEQAQEALDTYATRTALDAAGLAVLDRGSVKDLTALITTQYEERAQLDVIFGLAAVTTEQVGTIDQVTITGTLTDGQTPEDFTISYP